MQKNYAVTNMSYRDTERTSDYLLVRESGATKFNIPVNLPENIGCMFPSQLTEFICQDSLVAMENDQYTKAELNLAIEDLKYDIEAYTNENKVTIENGNFTKSTNIGITVKE